MTDFLNNIGSSVTGFLGDTVMDGIQAILYATIYKLLYYLAVGFCWIVDLLYSMFEVMAGLSKVSYDGDTEYLINVFFSNTTVSKIYWGMALIGMVVGFGFAIAAVIKKLFDTAEKEKRTYSQILSGLFKAILIILCMSLIISAVLNSTTLLMQQISYVFINADDLGEDESIVYSDEEFATMARILNTIGNFSLNPSYNNRYNLNKCFNEIRPDMQYLMQQGVFDFYYSTTDIDGNSIATWQSALQRIANSASLNRDLSLDVYNESVSNALLDTMELLRINGSFKPLEEYQRQYSPSRSSVPLDRLLFLMATMSAAKNDDYNLNPSLTDPLRGAYYYGEKSIYDLDTVNEDFDIGIAAFDYLILLLICWKLLHTLVTIILNCVGRIFNMLLLYLIAPLILGVSTLDDGAKFKQWTTAFVVQSLSVFGTVISMRVLLLFMPLITDDKLVLFANPIGNLLGKLIIILGGFEVAEKATSLITGILADNAGWQSITAGDMSSSAAKITESGKKYATSALKFGGKAGVTALKGAGIVGGGVGLGVGYGVYGVGKGTYKVGQALAGKISAWREQRAQAKQNQAASAEPEKQPQESYSPDNGQNPSFDQKDSVNAATDPVGRMSPKIAAMAAAIDAHNAQSVSTNQASPKIEAMAKAFSAHNENPHDSSIDPAAAGANASKYQTPVIKRSPKIAAMVALANAHNKGYTGPRVQRSEKISSLAQQYSQRNAPQAPQAPQGIPPMPGRPIGPNIPPLPGQGGGNNPGNQGGGNNPGNQGGGNHLGQGGANPPAPDRAAGPAIPQAPGRPVVPGRPPAAPKMPPNSIRNRNNNQ